jgi:hypothetical protein
VRIAEVDAPRSAVSDGIAKRPRVNAKATKLPETAPAPAVARAKPTPGIALGTGEKPNATSSASWRRQTQ